MERTERMKAVGQCFIVSAAVGVCVDRAHQTKAILIADLHLHSLRGLEWNDTEAAGNFTVSVSCLSSNFSPLFRSIYLRTITLNVLFILQRWCVGLSSPPSFGCGHFFWGVVVVVVEGGFTTVYHYAILILAQVLCQFPFLMQPAQFSGLGTLGTGATLHCVRDLKVTCKTDQCL